MRAALLLIGNELLSGKIQEGNLLPLSRMLRSLGHTLARAVLVPDEIELVASEVRAMSAAFDTVFTSGGIGPTHDDVTVAGVARAFEVDLYRHPTFEQTVRRKHGERTKPAHLRMADVPRGADVVFGEPPGWPVVRMRNVWLLAGVPEVFRMQLALAHAALPRLGAFHQTQVFVQLDEGQLAPWLDRVVAEFADVEVGSYPKWFDPSYKVKLTFEGRDPQRVAAAASCFLSLLPAGEPQRVESD